MDDSEEKKLKDLAIDIYEGTLKSHIKKNGVFKSLKYYGKVRGN